MNNFMTYTTLLGVRDHNLSPFRDNRLKQYRSVKKMVDLISIASKLTPSIPPQALVLDPLDPEWDDMMPFPTIDRARYVYYGGAIAISLFFYSYNYNAFTHNIKFRTFRNLFPLAISLLSYHAYRGYNQQITKINIFDEYCYLRSQELVKQNQYLLQHEDFKRYFWFQQDFRETLQKIYRQGHNHTESDFKDSELLLQDFISRYTNPQSDSPMREFTRIYQ